MTKKEYLESRGFCWNDWGYYAKESSDYRQCISIDEDGPYIKVICHSHIYSDADIKKTTNCIKQPKENSRRMYGSTNL